MIWSIISWVACALLLVGLKLIGDKRVLGFWIALAAEFMWIAWGAATGAMALVAMSVCISIMYIRAIRAWRRSDFT